MANGTLEKWASIICGFGYIYYCAIGFGFYPEKKFYNRLFDVKMFFLHFALTALLAGFAYHRAMGLNYGETFYFAPLVFLIVLVFFNWLTRIATERNIIIATKWDYKPPEYKWYIDGLFSFFIVLIPLVFCGYLSNKFRFGVFFI